MAVERSQNSLRRICGAFKSGTPMPNEPKHAKEKRTESGPRRNAQGNHEGSAHSPSEFSVMNPQRQDRGKKKPVEPPVDSKDDS